MTEYKFEKSRELHAAASSWLAGGVSSHFRSLGRPHPLFFSRGQGSRLFDVDGNEYIDYTLAQGPLILGHSHPEVLQKIIEELMKGQLFGGQFGLEVQLAFRLTQLIPGAELVRFCNSGSEAVHAAIRLARAFTGRKKILKFEGHYHGWFDNVLISVQPALVMAGDSGRPNPVPWGEGQPASALDEVTVLSWNDLDAVENVLEQAGDIAAVITEPIMCNTGCILPQPGFLEGLRDACDRAGALLIFDEIITGFRLGLGGAQQHFGVTPDLATFGKALASGFPISVLSGKKRFMNLIAEGRVLHAGTMNSNNVCVAACSATLDVLSRENGEIYNRLYKLGALLMEGLRERAAHRGHSLLVQGPGPMFHTGFTGLRQVKNYRESLSLDGEKLGKFVFGMLEKGVRVIGRGLWYVSAAHTEADIEQTLRVADEVFREM